MVILFASLFPCRFKADCFFSLKILGFFALPMPNIFSARESAARLNTRLRKKLGELQKKLLWGDRIFCDIVVIIKFGAGGKKIRGGVGVAIFFRRGEVARHFFRAGGKTFSGWGNKHFYGGMQKK